MFDLIPFRGDRSLFHYFDDLEKNLFSGSTLGNFSQFRTDIVDKGDSVELLAELPGFSKEDIKIELDNDTLTIRAEKSEETNNSQGSYIRKERRYGSFMRRFDVSGIDTENIAAASENGVLKLVLPKRKPDPLPPARQIEIQYAPRENPAVSPAGFFVCSVGYVYEITELCYDILAPETTRCITDKRKKQENSR